MTSHGFGTRRWAISGLIVISLAAQITQNLNIGYFGEAAGAPEPVRAAAWASDRVRWGIGQFAYYTSTNTYWRMFSPVHKIDWWWTVVATGADGSDVEIDGPSAAGASASSVLTGFRDAKLLLNLWNRPSMQQAYLDHRCRDEKSAGRAARAIRLELHWREILSPAQATATGQRVSDALATRVMASRACG